MGKAKRIEKIKCIRCPLGCTLKIKISEDGIEIEGNRCPRGVEFAMQELKDPMRILTTSVKVVGGKLPLVSVKTSGTVPRSKIHDLMGHIKKIKIRAPIKIGDVIEKNILGLGVDLVATRDCDER